MAEHIRGPLYYERMGRSGPLIAFVHPNPMDQSAWMYQVAHLSTWYRCIAIDLPGYGRSPHADAGLTMDGIAEACWDAVDAVAPGEPAVLVGCSIGSYVTPCMHRLRPDRATALVLAGVGHSPDLNTRVAGRMDGYRKQGLDYRWQYTFEDFSPAFRTTPMAHYIADLFVERNQLADVETILHQFQALCDLDAESVFAEVACPTLILVGSEDTAYARAFGLQERIAGSEVRVLPGAGHACQLEQPWLFDRFLLEFLDRQGLHPAALDG